jgi:hypothetical protein
MKKIIAFFILSGWALAGYSQEIIGETSIPDRYSVIKFQPFNLLFNSVSFEYEGIVSDHNAITLAVGIPNNKSFNTEYNNLEFFSKVKNAELGTTIIRAAFRHYFGNKNLQPAGFYVEPYLKYQHLKGNGIYIDTDQNFQSYLGETDLNLKTFNAGLQFGAQFLLGNRISLDVYFFGLEAGLASGDMSVVSGNAPQIADDINHAISDLPSYYQDRITVTESQYKVNVNAKNALYPWFRAGISIGIAF